MATTFRVQASGLDDPTFASPSYDQSGLVIVPVGNQYDLSDFTNIPTLPGQTYVSHTVYFRVNATVDGETSNWSNTVTQDWSITI